MKKLIVLIPLLASCQWVITHPKEDATIVKAIEEIGKDMYEYESGNMLFPLPKVADVYNPPLQ